MLNSLDRLASSRDCRMCPNTCVYSFRRCLHWPREVMQFDMQLTDPPPPLPTHTHTRTHIYLSTPGAIAGNRHIVTSPRHAGVSACGSGGQRGGSRTHCGHMCTLHVHPQLKALSIRFLPKFLWGNKSLWNRWPQKNCEADVLTTWAPCCRDG